MNEYELPLGMSVTNTCYECQVIAQSVEEGYPAGKCFTCEEEAEAREDQKAWDLHEDDRLGEGKGLSTSTADEPSASDWVSSKTFDHNRKWNASMIERWCADNPFKLEELTVIFEEIDEPTERSEFLPPTYNISDGGEFEELWELDDMRQRARETECQWCHLLTPKAFNDCQSCDKPLELNVR